MLYPRSSQTREVKNISGIWKFQPDPGNQGLDKKWFEKGLPSPCFMPVPSSFNDITQEIKIRDHAGWVWYEYEDYLPAAWKEKNLFLRFSAAAHKAKVYVNGEYVGNNFSGFLPFEFKVNTYVKWGGENKITVAVSNLLDWENLPPGEMRFHNDDMHPQQDKTLHYAFDFFNYAGIHRPVYWVAVPKDYIQGIELALDYRQKKSIAEYDVNVFGQADCSTVLYTRKGEKICHLSGNKARMELPDLTPWQPGAPHLYTMEFSLSKNGSLIDCYRLPVGFRSVHIEDSRLLINGRPFYFKGFGKHEDMDIRGRAFDEAVIIKDFNLLNWIGANSFRTSHYPYSEETLMLADEYGIAVIDECPAVGLVDWQRYGQDDVIFTEDKAGSKLLAHHKQVLELLVARDRHHPSVVLWSAANEAATYEKNAESYFKEISSHLRTLDPTRPLMIVENSQHNNSKAARFFDVIGINRYYSWYTDPGRLDVISFQLEKDLKDWHNTFKKPLLVTEFGADALAGLHADPPLMFSEEYQARMIEEFQKVVDTLPFVIGEHIWNFADFMTPQEVRRVIGNRKGVFTRQRQPKLAAHLLKKRWQVKPSFI
ncbi:MAG: beta-glucuronidase [Spirochaetales bacterium]|nr:beta-glucuronidase [Spirochaetales bacterium]